jgi:hypothetical protein
VRQDFVDLTAGAAHLVCHPPVRRVHRPMASAQRASHRRTCRGARVLRSCRRARLAVQVINALVAPVQEEHVVRTPAPVLCVAPAEHASRARRGSTCQLEAARPWFPLDYLAPLTLSVPAAIAAATAFVALLRPATHAAPQALVPRAFQVTILCRAPAPQLNGVEPAAPPMPNVAAEIAKDIVAALLCHPVASLARTSTVPASPVPAGIS